MLYIRGAFTILATGPGQVLFFIDSFERAHGHAGTLSSVPIFSLAAREDETNERGREKERERKNEKARGREKERKARE